MRTRILKHTRTGTRALNARTCGDRLPTHRAVSPANRRPGPVVKVVPVHIETLAVARGDALGGRARLLGGEAYP